ncbi:unnamed protein product, partial [Polarella glacialis]
LKMPPGGKQQSLLRDSQDEPRSRAADRKQAGDEGTNSKTRPEGLRDQKPERAKAEEGRKAQTKDDSSEKVNKPSLRPASASAVRGDLPAPEEEAVIGEWRQVENVVTIIKGRSGLTMFADTTQPPLTLSWLSGGAYEARRTVSGDLVYELQLNKAKDILEVKKGERKLNIFRIAKSKTLVGEWVHCTRKKIPVVEGLSHLEIRGEDRPVLRLLRRKILEWEAQWEMDYGWQPVYCLEHVEGSHRMQLRRPQELQDAYCIPLEFARAGFGQPPWQPLPPPEEEDRPPPGRRGAASAAAPSLDSAGQERRRPSFRGGTSRSSAPPPTVSTGVVGNGPGPCGYGAAAGYGAGSGYGDPTSVACHVSSAGSAPPPPRTSHREQLREFCSINELSDRVVQVLLAVGQEEQRHVMGLDSGRNTYYLTGTVRDPNAVVMSRLRRLEKEPLSGGRSGSRPPVRDRSDSPGRRSRSP